MTEVSIELVPRCWWSPATRRGSGGLPVLSARTRSYWETKIRVDLETWLGGIL